MGCRSIAILAVFWASHGSTWPWEPISSGEEPGYAQNPARGHGRSSRDTHLGASSDRPRKYRLDIEAAERECLKNGAYFDVPLGDSGEFATLKLRETTLLNMELGLASRLPSVKTFHGKAIGDRELTAELDICLSHGLHVQIFRPGEPIIYIEPISRASRDVYLVYSHRRHQTEFEFSKSGFPWAPPALAVGESIEEGFIRLQGIETAINTPTAPRIHTYRMALVANGEYSQFHGNTITSVGEALVSAINRINGIFKRELGINLQLIANNTNLICLHPCASLSNDNNIFFEIDSFILNNNVSFDDFDIAHALATSGGRRGAPSSVCSSRKDSAFSGLPSPTGDSFWVDYVSHVIGIQFGATPTMNGLLGSCASVRDSSWAYEIGSGSTIMGYAGFCAGDNIQTSSDPYFHVASLSQIEAFLQSVGGTCGTHVISTNAMPMVKVGSDTLIIPKNQPFRLNAIGSDVDTSNMLFYSWEQINLNTGATLTAVGTGPTDAPRFRSRLPTTRSFRFFPPLLTVTANTPNLADQLPIAPGNMTFAVTIRDHFNPLSDSGFGTWNADQMTVTVSDVEPLAILATAIKNTTEGSVFNITWNATSTSSLAPIVQIIFLTNDTFKDISLVSSTENDGSYGGSNACFRSGFSTVYGYFMVRSPPLNGSYWFSLSNLTSTSLDLSCIPTPSPTPSPVTFAPSLAPTRIPTGSPVTAGPVTVTPSKCPTTFEPSPRTETIAPTTEAPLSEATPYRVDILLDGTFQDESTVKTQRVRDGINTLLNTLDTDYQLSISAGSVIYSVIFIRVSSGRAPWQLGRQLSEINLGQLGASLGGRVARSVILVGPVTLSPTASPTKTLDNSSSSNTVRIITTIVSVFGGLLVISLIIYGICKCRKRMADVGPEDVSMEDRQSSLSIL